jgi:hypothetical protein
LCALIANWIETEPHRAAGHVWAGPFTHAAWARAIGVSPRTFQRLITHPPIVAQACGRGSDKGTLLRLGTPDPRNLKKVQNTMSKIWRENRNRDTTTRDEYGCICGMAEEMPPGWQVRIFEHALRRWSAFMAIVKLEIETAQVSAGHDIFEPSAMANPMLETARRFHGEELFTPGHLRWPSLKFLRKFHHVATDLFISDKGYLRERVFGLSE